MATLYFHNTTKNGYFETPFFESHRIMKCHKAETIQNGFWTRRQQLKKMPMLHLFAVFVTLKTISVFLKWKSFVATNIVSNGFFGLSCQFPHYYFSVQRNLVEMSCWKIIKTSNYFKLRSNNVKTNARTKRSSSLKPLIPKQIY